jgi:hypothetical protein
MFMLDDDEFECYTCGTIFKGTMFAVTCEWERVYYMQETRMVAVEGSLRLECYCSTQCRQARAKEVMNREQVPIPAIRPGLGPIEVCAMCRGPVDMCQFHRTYVEDQIESDGFNSTPIDVNYLAVLCRACDPWKDRTHETRPAIQTRGEKLPKSSPKVNAEVVFTPTSYCDFRIRAKRFRCAVGKEALSLQKGYNLFAKVCGYQSFHQLRLILVSDSIPETVWDSQLSKSELHSRRQAQIAVLVSCLPMSEADAAKLLDTGGYTNQPQRTARSKQRVLSESPDTEEPAQARHADDLGGPMDAATQAQNARARSSMHTYCPRGQHLRQWKLPC